MNLTGFPDDFIWGVATAAYQIEGASKEDGRGKSIWDTFCRMPGKVYQGQNGDVACDHYHRYKEDVALMKELGIQAYRFSLAWPRIFPQGRGKVNRKGIDFYSRLIDELCQNQIIPVATLYHWDLPQVLEDEGGWRKRETAEAFLAYAAECFASFHDRVPIWITFNEPFCSTYNGYYFGVHAPGARDMEATARAIHHINLAHGLAVKEFRDKRYKGKIGITQVLNLNRPATRSMEDVLAAEKITDHNSRIFLDPLFGKGYPAEFLGSTPDSKLPVRSGDLELIAQKMDFLGLNYYWEPALAHDETNPMKVRAVNTYYQKTEMEWDIVPAGLFRLLGWVNDNYDLPEIYITENGCALPDELSKDGSRCHDPGRISYLREHFKMIKKALAAGIKVKGYFLWSIIDNFEWAYGYNKRFGIVYCDYAKQRRIPKDSYYFYREIIAGHEFLE